MNSSQKPSSVTSVIIINKEYPTPGGRCTFIQALQKGFTNKYTCTVISKRTTPNAITLFHLFGRISFYIETFGKLILLPRPACILGVGLSSWAGMLYARLQNIPAIYNLSDTNTVLQPQGIRAKVGKLFTQLFEYSALHLANTITVPSAYAGKQVIAQYPFVKPKVLVIPEAPLPCLTKRKPVKNRILLPWLSERKNASLFIKTIPELLAQTDAHLLLPGNIQKLTVAQQKIIHEAQEKKRVLLAKETTTADARKRFITADLFVYIPPKEAHSYHLLEALEVGLPCIISPVGWLKEEFGMYSLMLEACTTAEIIKKIKYYFAHKKEVSKEYEKKRNKILSKYNYPAMIKAYEKLVKKT